LVAAERSEAALGSFVASKERKEKELASEAQIKANRRNAKKSTGPKTAKGKEIVSKNAVKHGFFSRDDVVKDEDQADFDRYRLAMLDVMGPVGVLERSLAERVVSLSWRLRRAERMQDQSLKLQIHRDWVDLRARQLKYLFNEALGREQEEEPMPEDDHFTVGRAARNDVANWWILDKLMIYERRIENSMLRIMTELRRVQAARKADEVRGIKTDPAADPYPIEPAKPESPEQTTPQADANSDCAKQTQSTRPRTHAKLTVLRTCAEQPPAAECANKPDQSQSDVQAEPCEPAKPEVGAAHGASRRAGRGSCR